MIVLLILIFALGLVVNILFLNIIRAEVNTPRRKMVNAISNAKMKPC